MTAALNLLVIEDHDDLRDITVSALSDMGYTVIGLACAEDIDEQLSRFQPDVVLLDLGLPGEDGLSLARRLRAAQPGIGIIMVTARDRPRDTLDGYNAGADIYVTKPTSPEELDAAIRALERRLRPPPAHPLTLDGQRLCLSGPAGEINLSHTDYQLLAALARARDYRLETWQLLEILGKPLDEPEKKALTVHFVRLRKKLTEIGAPEPTIKVIRGSGYQLCAPLVLR